MLTDLIVSNPSTAVGVRLYRGDPSCASIVVYRLLGIIVHKTLVIPLNTGVNFGTGHTVCVQAEVPGGAFMSVNARGYQFGPS